MKLIFIYDRLSHNKWYATLVDEALARGHDAICYLNHTDISQTTKWYEFPAQDQMPKFRNGTPRHISFRGPTELEERLAAEGEAVIFATRPPISKHPGQRWVHVVSSFFDSLIGAAPSELVKFDLIFCNTQYWIDACLGYFVNAGLAAQDAPELRTLRAKMVATGTTQYDHFALCERAQARRVIGIPPGAKVVTVYVFDTSATYWSQRIFHVPRLLTRLFYWLVLPFSYPYVFSRLGKKNLSRLLFTSLRRRWTYLKAVFLDPSELDVLRRIRAYCDRTGCFLVFKYRKKSPAKWFQKEISDLPIYEDTSFYPYSSAQTISASDMLITFYSSSVGESSFRGVPSISLFPDDDNFFFEDNYLLLRAKNADALARAETELYYNRQEGGVFNSPGIVNGMTLREFCAASDEKIEKCFHVSPVAKQDYITKFIQADAGPSAARILDVLEGNRS